jgi:hypothetical protein
MNETSHGIAPERYQTITAPQNTENAVDAMRSFLRDGDAATFANAVALYVAAARYRQEAIETVVAALCTLAESLEGPRRDSDIRFRPSKMHELIFTGVLKAFYGEIAVERARGASAQRKADAPQHTERGTWPRRPEE